MAKPTGIRQRGASWEAFVYDRRAKTKIRKTFATKTEAKRWRADALGAVERRTLKATSPQTLRKAWEAWEAGALEGSIRNRSGDVYKPSVLRSYSSSMRLYVLEELGAVKLGDVSRVDLQNLAGRLLARQLDPSTIRNALMPLRVVFGRAVERGELAVNPATGIRLPAVRGSRDRIADPDEAAQLIAAVPEEDRVLWATACYAGLRLGELRALEHDDVDLELGLIHVRRSWDPKAGPVEPKSRAGVRTVPIVAALRAHLAAHLLRSRRRTGLIFGQSETTPFTRRAISNRAARAWTAAELEPIGWHELRHTCASIFIAAGVNAKALSSYLGHASISITLDRYGHLMPGNEDEAAALVDAYLERTGAGAGASGAETAPLSQAP